jgi:hypothetical protein
MGCSAILLPLQVPFLRCHCPVHFRALGHIFCVFCLTFLLGLIPGLDQPLKDSSNHTHLLTAPSLIPQPLIKNLIGRGEDNGFTHMLSIELNFCQGPQGVFSLYETNFYQYLHCKWTGTHALICSVHNMDIDLYNQPFTTPITTTIQNKRPIQPTPF